MTDAGIARVSGQVDEPGRVVYLVSSDGHLAAAEEPGPGGEWEVEVPAGEVFAARAFVYDPGRDALVPLCPRAEGQLGAAAQAERSRG